MVSIPERLRHIAAQPSQGPRDIEGPIDRCIHCGTVLMDRRPPATFRDPWTFKATGVLPLAVPGAWPYPPGTVVEKGRDYQVEVINAPIVQTLDRACWRQGPGVLQALRYRNYRASRHRSPAVAPERWGALGCFKDWSALEARFQAEQDATEAVPDHA